MQFRNGKIPLDTLNSKGWGVKSSDKDALIKAFTGMRLEVDTGLSHMDDGNMLAVVGAVTHVKYDSTNNCLRLSGVITDRRAEIKFEDKTWNQTWSPRIEGVQEEDGFVSDPVVKALKIVTNPAWSDATFDVDTRQGYSFTADDTTPPEPVKTTTDHPLNPNKTPPNELNITVAAAPPVVTPPVPPIQAPTPEYATKADFAALMAKIETLNTVSPSVAAAPAVNGLTEADIERVMDARVEAKKHSDTISRYVDVCRSKGVAVKVEDITSFSKFTSSEIEVLIGQISGIQAKPIFNDTPEYYNPQTGTGGLNSNATTSGFTAGYKNAAGEWVTD